MKKLTKQDKTYIAIQSAVWNHGRKKALITGIIRDLKQTEISNDPAILKAIEVLQKEKNRLQKVELF